MQHCFDPGVPEGGGASDCLLPKTEPILIVRFLPLQRKALNFSKGCVGNAAV